MNAANIQFLSELICAVNKEVHMDRFSQRTILRMLNTNEKIFIFNRWLNTMMKDGVLVATPRQVCCAAGSANRLEWPM